MTSSTERAVLAGGCFWGMQDLIRKYPGVISAGFDQPFFQSCSPDGFPFLREQRHGRSAPNDALVSVERRETSQENAYRPRAT